MSRLAQVMVAALLLPGCFFADVSLEGHACEEEGDCLEGYVCRAAVCVKPDEGGEPDAGATDAGEPDAGRPDGGEPDAGLSDAGELDAGEPDAGEADAGEPDAGEPDAGEPDAGEPDAGEPDGGPVPNAPPAIVSIQPTVNGIAVLLEVNAEDQDGTIAAVSVDWGDGEEPESFPGAEPLALPHSYTRAASFIATVMVFDDDGEPSAPSTVSIVTQLPTDQLIVHLPFDGDHLDAAGSNQVFFSGAENYAIDRFGFGSRALSMHNNNESGTLALVSTGNLAAQGFTESFSVALWINVTNGFGGSDGRIAGQGDWFNLYSRGSGVSWGVLNGISEDASQPKVVDQAVLGSGWRFYVGVVEADASSSTLRLYRNGALIDETTVPQTLANPGTCRFYVGTFGGGNLCTGTQADEFNGFPGLVDDVRVYGRALRPAEVEALFHEGE